MKKFTKAESYRVLTDEEREELERAKEAHKHQAKLQSLRTTYDAKNSS